MTYFTAGLKYKLMKSNITARVSTVIRASISNVWEALTKPEIIKQYFFGTDTHTDWKVGQPIRFTGEWEGQSYEDKGTVLAFDHHKRISYTYWSSMSGLDDEPQNYVTVSYRLSEEHGNTRLEITQEHIPDEKTKEHSEENWNKVLSGIKDLLEQKEMAI